MTYYTIFDRPLAVTGGDSNGSNVRQYIPTTAYNPGAPPTASHLRIFIRAATAGDLNWSEFWIGHGGTSGTIMDFDGTQISLGVGSQSAGTTGPRTSTPYAWSKLKPLIISLQVTYPGNVLQVPDPDVQSALCDGGAGATGVAITNIQNKISYPKVEAWFDDPPGDPTCTVDPAPGQAVPTPSGTVHFRANWNKGVSGLTVGDIDLTSSTTGGTLVAVVEGSDFGYNIDVTGMLLAGNVVVKIPVGAVTAVSDGLSNSAVFTGSIAWDPDIIDPEKPNVVEVTVADKHILRVEILDPAVQLGYSQVLSSPDSGTGTHAITNVVNNGHGIPRVTCPELADFNGAADNIYVQDIVASPISNGAGGQRIRCTVYDTSLSLFAGPCIQIRQARGTYEANTHATIDSFPGEGRWNAWTFVIIDATHIDLVYRARYDPAAVTTTPDTTKPATFANAYLGGGVALAPNSGPLRVTIHSVTGTTEINGAWTYCRSGLTTCDVFVPNGFINTYTGGGRVLIIGRITTTSILRPNPAKDDEDDYCMISGRLGKRLRFIDRRPALEDYLNKEAAAVAANYTVTGRTVTAVHRHTMPYSAGSDNVVTVGLLSGFTASRHYYYLVLNSDLTNGTYTIQFPPATNLPPKTFTYNDKTTRFCAIHADQNGHRPGDNKYAHLSLWIAEYGTYGEVDYSDVANYHLIDESGTIVWTSPGAPTLRCTPTSVEGTEQADGFQYFEANPKLNFCVGAPIKIADITNANPGVVRVQDVADMARLANGDIFTFSDLYHYNAAESGVGMSQIEEKFFSVASKAVDGADKFRLAAAPLTGALGGDWAGNIGNPNTTAIPAFAQTVRGNHGNWLYKVNVNANRAGTNVYGCDYSSYTGSGTVKLYFPGRGVSDPIYLQENRWHRCWKFYTKAMYHQRSGIELDGRFGTTRPINMKHIEGVQEVYKSKMSYSLSNYSLNRVQNPLLDVGFNNNGISGGYAPWITNIPTPAYGGHVDAGDFDVRINETWIGYFQTLLIWTRLSAAAQASLSIEQAGTPTCLEAGLDPTVFAGTDDLPGPLVEVIWGIEPQRLGQETSGPNIGGTIGGLNYGEGVPDRETSWEITQQPYAWAVDPHVSMNYCAVAAKLAEALLDLGYTALGGVYQASAIAAWNFAAPFLVGNTRIVNDTVVDAFYAEQIALGGFNLYPQIVGGSSYSYWDANKHVQDATYLVTYPAQQFLCMDAMDHVGKGVAAAALFTLTGGATYKAFCDANYPAQEGNPMSGTFEYGMNPAATLAVANACKTAVKARALDYYLQTVEDDTISYSYPMARGFWNMAFGMPMNWVDSAPALTMAAMVAAAEGDTVLANRCRRALQRQMTFRHGGNQMGLCMTNGLGVRHCTTSLHLDSRHTGQPLPVGITSEAWSNDFPLNTGGAFTVNSNTWFGTIQAPEADPVMIDATADKTLHNRELYPYNPLAIPLWDRLYQYYFYIEHMEYTTQQQLQPAYNNAMYLHAWDGNDATAEEDPGPELPAEYIVSRPTIRVR